MIKIFKERARLSQPEARPLKRWRRYLRLAVKAFLVVVAALVVTFLLVFPGRQTPIAFTLATGLGISDLQGRVDRLETKAIEGAPLTSDDRLFLRNLYCCFAKGGQVTIVLRQSGQFMQHYLAGSGDDLRTSSRIFINARPVQAERQSIRQQLLADLDRGTMRDAYSTQTFSIGDREFADAFVGLYNGRVIGRPSRSKAGALVIHWRAEAPWNWPSYASIRKQYGNYHARCFPLPNARSWLQGSRYCLHVDDGLGSYLADIGLAKPFLVFSEWNETITP